MGEQNHWSERGRATLVADADALGRPHRSLLSFGTMKECFEVMATNGLCAVARLERHQGVCWRYVLSVDGNSVGDVLFEHESGERVELRDINIFPEYRSRGFGTGLLRALIDDWRSNGFAWIVGIVVAHDGADKTRLCRWYERIGAEVVREDDRQNPGYAGKLRMKL